MNVLINGKTQQLPAVKNISEIVSSLCKNPKHVITELNGNIVPSEMWADTKLNDGDALELVSFVGGG